LDGLDTDSGEVYEHYRLCIDRAVAIGIGVVVEYRYVDCATDYHFGSVVGGDQRFIVTSDLSHTNCLSTIVVGERYSEEIVTTSCIVVMDY